MSESVAEPEETQYATLRCPATPLAEAAEAVRRAIEHARTGP